MAKKVPDDLFKEVADLIDRAYQTGAIVSAWEEIKTLLVKNSLAWTQQCKPEHVATHKNNRSGEGVGAIQSHYHGYDIVSEGWSWHKAADAVAVEYVDGDIENLDFNNKLVDISDGMFPPFRLVSLLSVSASHTNAFLRSVKFNCRSACPMPQFVPCHAPRRTSCGDGRRCRGIAE